MNLLQTENRVGRVRLNDIVNPWTADELIGDIERTYGAKAVADNLMVGGFMATDEGALEVLVLDLHTPGGSVLDGYRVHQSLMSMRERGVKVIANVNTLAASMGSVIIMAADEINIVQGGRIMIHEAAQTVSGNAADHARAAKNLDEMSDEIAAVYANRTGSPVEDMRALMRAETWMGAKEAVERGFADAIIGAKPVETSKQADKQKAMGLFSKTDNADALVALEAENIDIRNQFAELQASAAENAAQVVALRDEVELLTAQNAKHVEDFASAEQAAEAASAKLTEEIAAQSALLDEANEKLAGFEAEVAARAINEIAALGFTGKLPESANDENGAPNRLTRAAFRTMSPAAKLNFCKSGGEII